MPQLMMLHLMFEQKKLADSLWPSVIIQKEQPERESMNVLQAMNTLQYLLLVLLHN